MSPTSRHHRPGRLLAALTTGTLLCASVAAVVDGSRALAVTAGVTAPGAPSISAIHAGDGRLSVDVHSPSKDGGAPILGYVATAAGGGRTVSASSTSHTVTLTGLYDGVTYLVTVKAYNSSGFGPASSGRTAAPIAGPVTLTLTGGPTFVPIGTQETFSGILDRSNAPAPGELVSLSETFTDGRVVPLGQTVTGSNGGYSFTTSPLYNGRITVSALTAVAAVDSRVIVAMTAPKLTAHHGRSIEVRSSSAPGFIIGVGRQERAQLLQLDGHGHTIRVLALVDASQRAGRHGFAHGVNDLTFRLTLPHAGAFRLAVRVLGTPVNTGATSTSLTVRV